MGWRLIQESETPSDKKTILASFSKDVSDEKFSPSVGFIRTAYSIFNSKFFGGKLPESLQFKVKTQPTKSYIGMASYVFDRITGKVNATSVTLNGARTLTLHEWLEVVLHEMIHVLDYETNPQHFVGYGRRSYDAHGYWFMSEGKKYERHGFHVQKFCNADLGVNTSSKKVNNRIQNSVFVCMDGDSQYPYMMKMSRKNLDRNLEYIVQRIGKSSSFGAGVQEILVMTSENPNISLLKDLRMRDSSSRISWWWGTDSFIKKFGPFKEEDKISVLKAKHTYTEDDKEVPEPEEPDEVIDDIEDSIKGVEDVKEIGKDKFLVSIP